MFGHDDSQKRSGNARPHKNRQIASAILKSLSPLTWCSNHYLIQVEYNDIENLQSRGNAYDPLSMCNDFQSFCSGDFSTNMCVSHHLCIIIAKETADDSKSHPPQRAIDSDVASMQPGKAGTPGARPALPGQAPALAAAARSTTGSCARYR
jgi:hypothetical protein